MSTICIKSSEKLVRASLGAIVVALACLVDSVSAQIMPDNTMGGENSTVTSSGEVDAIDGGVTRGANLFHSFQEFNVNEGRAAVFTNPNGIENILTRVTGANSSNILGTLGVAGNANLFLLNPNGIIFGANARLDVGGSFVATTANAIGFGDRGVFSTTNPSNPGLLTVNPSALLFNQIRAAAIQNNTVAPSGLNPSSEFTAKGLRVPDGKSLLLVGGDINMNGGGLFAFGGRVELGGLAGAGTVGLNWQGNNPSLSFTDGVEKSDVSLSNGADVDVTAGDGGSIAVNARNLGMIGESTLFAGIASKLGSDNSKAGNIEVNATGAINLNASYVQNLVRPGASGQGGDARIRTSSLRLESGAQVSATTYSSGKGGNLTVDASDVQLIGISADGQLASGLGATAEPNSIEDAGDAGNLNIQTNTLLVRDGAQVIAATAGAGKGGNLTVDASDVQLIGTSADGQVSSGLGATTQSNSTEDAGDAGNLNIQTNTLLVRDGALVFTGTFGVGKAGNINVEASDVQLIGTSVDGQSVSTLNASATPNSTGNAGNLNIQTNTLLVRDGAQVSTATFGAGKGGSLTVNASDVQLIGRSADGQFFSGLGSSAQPDSTGDAGNLTINTNNLVVRDGAEVRTATFGAGKGGSLTVNASDVQLIGRSADGQYSSGLAASARRNSTGNAGNLTINTNNLVVRDGARVGVQSLGTGTAGNMTLNAHSIRLDNSAELSANTRSAFVDPNVEQATINISSQNLLMSRNSNIFTNAEGENVIGGNINIDTDLLVAFENSDISANSANFRGGNVRIDVFGIFGTQFREVPDNRTSDITAKGSNPQLSGTVELNIPEIEPNSNLDNLPLVPVDTRVVRACTPSGAGEQSEFVVTGRGGLPDNPRQSLGGDATDVDLVTLDSQAKGHTVSKITKTSTSRSSAPLMEATEWETDSNGKVVLTARASTATQNLWQLPADCKAVR